MQTGKLRGWRRVAAAMWPAPNDPQIFGTLDLDASAVLEFIDAARAAGHHLTPTHLVARAVGAALEAVPELNVRISGNRYHERARIEIFIIAALRFSGADDLSGVKVDVTRRNVLQIARALEEGVRSLREGKDPDFSRSKRLMDALPVPLLRVALHTMAVLTERLQLDIPSLALRRSPFGSAIVSSVGSLGLPHGFAPLSWMYDVPLLVLIGEIADKPVVVDKKVVVRPILPLSVTIDHRYVDGAHLSRAMRALRDYLQDPFAFEALGERERAPARTS